MMCLQRDYADELHGGLEGNLISCAHQNKTFSDSLKSSLPFLPHWTKSLKVLQLQEELKDPKLTYILSKLLPSLS